MLGKLGLYGWGALQVVRLGRPDVSFGFFGGLGDDLLCTAPVAEHLRRGAKRIWFFTRHPELHAGIDPRVRLVPEDPRYLALAARLGRPMRPLSYSVYDAAADRDTALDEHLIAAMCRRAGLNGAVRLQPHLSVTAAELAGVQPWEGCLAIQAAGLAAAVPMRNKQWPIEHWQQLVDSLPAGAPRAVQIGAATDPLLRGVTDLRGRTGLRGTAALLARARLFVGTVGFPMHLARAVGCPAVIVYGGREPARVTGYPCNANVENPIACSPCWQRNRCEYDVTCMRGIPAETVAAAVVGKLAEPRGPLTATEVSL